MHRFNSGEFSTMHLFFLNFYFWDKSAIQINIFFFLRRLPSHQTDFYFYSTLSFIRQTENKCLFDRKITNCFCLYDIFKCFYNPAPFFDWWKSSLFHLMSCDHTFDKSKTSKYWWIKRNCHADLHVHMFLKAEGRSSTKNAKITTL